MGDVRSGSIELGIHIPPELEPLLSNPVSGPETSDMMDVAIDIPHDSKPLLSRSETSTRSEREIYIQKTLDSLSSDPVSRPKTTSIYRVPRKLREINPEAYTPRLVSIGPIHRNDEHLKSMTKYKFLYLAELCDGKECSELWTEIQRCEEEIRSYYEDNFDDLSSEEFVEMVLLDSAFIIMILKKKYQSQQRIEHSSGNGLPETSQPIVVPPESVNHPQLVCRPCPPDDYALSKPWRDYTITLDLILLENQLPYFVLDKLYSFSFGDSPSFYDLTCQYFLHYVSPPAPQQNDTLQELKAEEEYLKELKRDHRHFTDLIRQFWSRNGVVKKDYYNSISSVYSITKLHDAGVTFKMDPEAWPLKMEFKKGVLKMPGLYFDDTTECLIRNLVAYEQCHDPYDANISEYFVLLSFLINTENDVELLARKGIVTNLLDDTKAVTAMVKGLGKEIAEVGNRYHPLYLMLNAHCENWWNRRIAILRKVYFSNMWRGTATVAAFVILVCTVIQAVNSFWQ